MKLLLRKFEDPASGDVNYPAFVQAVDQGNYLVYLQLWVSNISLICINIVLHYPVY